jgi:tetratricopeptide (TPR) repeat protein
MFKGDYEKAKELFADSHHYGLPTDSYLQVFAQCEKSQGKYPAEIARNIATTGIELSSKEKYDEAFEYFKFALDFSEKEALRLHLQISLCICVLDVLRGEHKRALYVLKEIENDFEFNTDPQLRESNMSLKKEGEFLRDLISKLERNEYNVTFPSLE